MKKEILIDLKDVKNFHDIVYRFYKAVDCYYYLSEEEMLKRIKVNEQIGSWDAFRDNLSGLPLNFDGSDVVFVIENIDDILKLKNGEQSKRILIDILDLWSDPTQRVDRLNFSYEIK